MKFYIASKLENATRVRELAEILKSWGWKHTYDWTEHGRVLNREALQSVAAEELAGAVRADLVIILLPGGKGTHTELGIALSHKKEIIMHSERLDPFDANGGETCSFYWLPGIERVCCPWEELPRWLRRKYGRRRIDEAEKGNI